MERVQWDCARCRSAGSVSKGICQVCLAEMKPMESHPVRVGTALALSVLRREPAERLLAKAS